MKKLYHQYNRKIWIVAVISLLVAIITFQNLPMRIPIHFDVTGTPDNYGSRWTIFLFPAINFLLIFLGDGLRKIDPRAESYEKFESKYYNFIFMVSLLMLGVEVMIIAFSLGYTMNVSRIIPVLVGLLFVYLGNVMPKFKHNYFVGIKTSWTLASEQVWYLTHRLTGKVWVAGGIVMLGSVLLPLNMIIWTILAVVTALVLVPVITSYYFFKKHEK